MLFFFVIMFCNYNYKFQNVTDACVKSAQKRQQMSGLTFLARRQRRDFQTRRSSSRQETRRSEKKRGKNRLRTHSASVYVCMPIGISRDTVSISLALVREKAVRAVGVIARSLAQVRSSV